MDSEEYCPKVSIIIPVYNGAHYLREAIDSALAQTYKNVEIIVVNDGSTDKGETENIALSYENRIRYIHKANGGVASALNTGIRNMTGEYFSWLSHDDVYYPHKVSTQVRALTYFGHKVILFSDYEFIDQTGNFKRKRITRPSNEYGLRMSFITDDPIGGCTTLVPKSCFDTCGLFSEELRTIQDYDMWFRLSYSFCFAHIPQVLVKVRQHAGQGSRTIPSFIQEAEDYFSIRVSEITDEEIRLISHKHPALFFLKLAFRIKWRGYTIAADRALFRSDQAASELTPRDAFVLIVLRICYIILSSILKPAFWLHRRRYASVTKAK